MLKKSFCALLLSAAVFVPAAFCASVSEITSPDNNIVLRVSNEPALSYSVQYKGETVVALSKIGIKIKDAAPFGAVDVTSSEAKSVNQTWEYPWGRQKTYRDQYNSVAWKVKERTGSRTLGLEFRVYNDGVALRYLIDKGTVDADEYTLEQDLTEFNFNADHTAWYADFGSFSSSQEKPCVKQNLSLMGSNAHVGCPVVIQTGEKGPYLALTEAELNHWGGLYFQSAEPAEVQTLFDSGVLKTG
ncbi:MAG: glycoside hydrolase family 97 N-terminal domain-containing protein, partial [Planctomycetaceae bacterium]|nr:glycoside hydrolase family 97 N-terminal domain-containing protein [Planctomycetaceae bacterium]